MSSKVITEPRENPPERHSGRDEVAPSVMAQDEPTVPRFLGMLGAALLVFGGTILLLQLFGLRSVLGTGYVALALALGLAGLLFHAAYDADIQFRRMYMGFGLMLMLAGGVLCLSNWLQYYFVDAEAKAVRDLFTPGVGCLLLAVLFVLATLRHENQSDVFQRVTLILLGVGAAAAIIGFGMGMIKTTWLAPYGVVLPLVGLFYLVAFVGSRGISDDLAYTTGWTTGLVGLAVTLVAVIRSLSVFVWNAYRIQELPAAEYFIPYGVLLILFGLLYVLASVLLCSENLLVVLVRRELGAYFYSPIFYIVLLAFTVAHWIVFSQKFALMYLVAKEGEALYEPIVVLFILDWPAIFCNVFIVPALTMRLLSEEQRSGTLEVLLTAPVGEAAVVLSKFLAGLMMYVLIWLPFGCLLIALRLMGGSDFDYRPLLSFGVVIVVTGSAFIAIGLLFSSLTRDQIASGVLTFVVMLTLTLTYLLQRAVGPGWTLVLEHVSYINLWIDSLNGKLTLRDLIFPLSLSVFCLFLTTKILEARKWK